jgi:hypothetical protein
MKVSRQLQAFLNSLRKHPSAWPFLAPVDATIAPDYYQVIKEPRDLSLIQSKTYETEKDLIDDVVLMLQNCFMYNPPTHIVHETGRTFLSFLKDQTSRSFPHLVIIDREDGYIDVQNVINAQSQDPRPKRNIKAPKVFEPEHIPSSSAKRRESSRGPMELLKQLKRKRESGDLDANDLQIETIGLFSGERTVDNGMHSHLPADHECTAVDAQG